MEDDLQDRKRKATLFGQYNMSTESGIISKFGNLTKAEMAQFAEATMECLEYGRVYDLLGAWKYLQRGVPPEMQLSKLDLYIDAFTGEIKTFRFSEHFSGDPTSGHKLSYSSSAKKADCSLFEPQSRGLNPGKRASKACNLGLLH